MRGSLTGLTLRAWAEGNTILSIPDFLHQPSPACDTLLIIYLPHHLAWALRDGSASVYPFSASSQLRIALRGPTRRCVDLFKSRPPSPIPIRLRERQPVKMSYDSSDDDRPLSRPNGHRESHRDLLSLGFAFVFTFLHGHASLRRVRLSYMTFTTRFPPLLPKFSHTPSSCGFCSDSRIFSVVREGFA